MLTLKSCSPVQLHKACLGELATVVSWCRRMAKGENPVCLLVQHETQPVVTHWGRDRSSGVLWLSQKPYPSQAHGAEGTWERNIALSYNC